MNGSKFCPANICIEQFGLKKSFSKYWVRIPCNVSCRRSPPCRQNHFHRRALCSFKKERASCYNVRVNFGPIFNLSLFRRFDKLDVEYVSVFLCSIIYCIFFIIHHYIFALFLDFVIVQSMPFLYRDRSLTSQFLLIFRSESMFFHCMYIIKSKYMVLCCCTRQSYGFSIFAR